MARGEITGKKPVQTADQAKRLPGPPTADATAIEPTAKSEPDAPPMARPRRSGAAGAASLVLGSRVLLSPSAQHQHVLQAESGRARTARNSGRLAPVHYVRRRGRVACRAAGDRRLNDAAPIGCAPGGAALLEHDFEVAGPRRSYRRLQPGGLDQRQGCERARRGPLLRLGAKPRRATPRRCSGSRVSCHPPQAT